MAQLVKFDWAQVLNNAGVQKVKEVACVCGKDLHKKCPEAWENIGEAAMFLGGHLFVYHANPGNWGTCNVTKLTPSVNYEVSYLMAMTEKDVSSEVTLTLELPNGCTEKKIIHLNMKKGEPRAVSVGTFLNTFLCGDIKFSFSGEGGDTWKGLLIQEVAFIPALNK